MFSVKWGGITLTSGYYVNVVEMGGHTPPSCSQKGGSLRPLLRRGAVSPKNMPEKKQKMVFVLGMDCGHLDIAPLLNVRKVGARGSASHGLGLPIPPFGFNTPGAHSPSTTSLLILGVLYCTIDFGGCLIIGNVGTISFGDCLLIGLAWIFCLPGVRIGRSAPMTDRLQMWI